MTISGLWVMFAQWLAGILPHRLVYFCAIRVGAKATSGKYGNQDVHTLFFWDAIKRWEETK